MSAITKKERDEARQRLAEQIKPGDNIATVTQYASSGPNGTTAYVRVFATRDYGQGPEMAEITAPVGIATGRRARQTRRHYGIQTNGGGYSRGLDVYIDLRYALKQEPEQRFHQEL